MAHETHHGEGHHHHPIEATPKISLSSAFWFVLILVGLFVAAVNFVSVESKNSEEHASTERYEGTETGHVGGVDEQKANKEGGVTPTTAPAAAETVKESETTANPKPAVESIHGAVDTNKH